MTRKRAVLTFVACLPLGLPVCLAFIVGEAALIAGEAALRWWRRRKL